jgi:hypothetical protein
MNFVYADGEPSGSNTRVSYRIETGMFCSNLLGEMYNSMQDVHLFIYLLRFVH